MLRVLTLLLGLLVLTTSCRSSKTVTRKRSKTVVDTRTNSDANSLPPRDEAQPADDKVVNPVPKTGVEGYIEQFAAIAQEEMAQYGIPASITLAQGILESGAGNGDLVRRANNHFGIKCHEWKGARVYHDDDEKGECFRKYTLAKFSYRDHSLFLTNRKRYMDLFKLPKDDYKGWARGLRAAGYATDRKYPAKLISLIERYQLYRYDGEVLGKDSRDYKKVVDHADQHTVRKGETLYRIAKKYNITVDALKAYNGLESNDIFEGQVLYVKPLEKGY